MKPKKSNRYKKPIFIKYKKLTFPREIISKFGDGGSCHPCGRCHGCRG